MRPDDVREHLARRPFQPFRVQLSTGLVLDIRESELAHVSRMTLTLGFPIEDGKQRFMIIALIHIVWIEVLLPTP